VYHSAVSDFKQLKVWQKAHALALDVHRITSRIRGRDSIGVRSQMLRAAMSVPANIVEGTGHGSRREFIRFIRIAAASASELESHLIMARDSHVISATECDALCARIAEIRKMLYGLSRRMTEAASLREAAKGAADPLPAVRSEH